MPDLRAILRAARHEAFSGVAYRVCPALYARNVASMRGAFQHGGRYNIRGYFGALYASLEIETARKEMARYFTVPPRDGFVEAEIEFRLHRVVDLTDRALLKKADTQWSDLVGADHMIAQEFGQRAWEIGIEALVVPSAADPKSKNLAVFLDNQHGTPWTVGVAQVRDAVPFG